MMMNSMVGAFRRGLLVLLCMVMQSCHPDPLAGQVPVSLTGVHHMTDRFMIGEFYVDGNWGGNIHRGGGGGSSASTGMTLPSEYRAGQTVQVKWTLFDEWYRTVTTYEATVPVEPYDDLWRFGVHFFPDARVRVVSTRNGGPGKLAPEISLNEWKLNSNPNDYYPLAGSVAQGKVLSVKPYYESECWHCSEAELARDRARRARYKAEREAYEQAQQSKKINIKNKE
jgi:hypothetical protein